MNLLAGASVVCQSRETTKNTPQMCCNHENQLQLDPIIPFNLFNSIVAPLMLERFDCISQFINHKLDWYNETAHNRPDGEVVLHDGSLYLGLTHTLAFDRLVPLYSQEVSLNYSIGDKYNSFPSLCVTLFAIHKRAWSSHSVHSSTKLNFCLTRSQKVRAKC